MRSCLSYLKDVSKAQATRQVGQGSTYLITIRDRQIFCIPKKHGREGDFVIGQVSEFQCLNGLTTQEWHSIEKRITQAIKEKRL